MLAELPVTNSQTDYKFSILLDGTRYFLRFRWNLRIETWFMDLENSTQEVLLSGIPCLTNVQNMCTRFALPNVLPFGDVLILDSSGNGADPDLENFSGIVSAFYLSIMDKL